MSNTELIWKESQICGIHVFTECIYKSLVISENIPVIFKRISVANLPCLGWSFLSRQWHFLGTSIENIWKELLTSKFLKAILASSISYWHSFCFALMGLSLNSNALLHIIQLTLNETFHCSNLPTLPYL